MSGRHRNADRNNDTYFTPVVTAKEYTMTREDFLARWRTRQSEWARIGALVDGARSLRRCASRFRDCDAGRRLTPSSAYPRLRCNLATLVTISVGCTGWASYQRIAKDGTCSSARAIYRGSRRRQRYNHTILSRMLDGPSVNPTTSDIREEA